MRGFEVGDEKPLGASPRWDQGYHTGLGEEIRLLARRMGLQGENSVLVKSHWYSGKPEHVSILVLPAAPL